jgi:uncharacterized short protein YbdD (DUF466 family)
VNARRVARIWRALAVAARRIAGIPDYDAYVAHLRSHHPERAIPSEADFFVARQQARYSGGGGRCC